MSVSRIARQVVYLGVGFELLLGVLGLFICWYLAIPVLNAANTVSVLFALGMVLLLLVSQIPLYFLLRAFPRLFRGSRQFVKEVLEPFCGQLTYTQALLVSLGAGIGEELFFRAALLPWIGIVASSVLFAVVHFGLAAFRYPFFICCYFLISLGFSFQYLLTGDIFSVILAHALYDFLAIVRCKRGASL